jgi:hypothetical protein
MPLLDHFQDSTGAWHPWESFLSVWACEIAALLNKRLSDRHFATLFLQFSPRISAEVARFESEPEDWPQADNTSSELPPFRIPMPAVYPDDLEVRVHDKDRDAQVVAVIELVSPGNKDRPETRRAFAAKCAAYLQRGIGVVTVDIVTSRQFNLHNELVRLLGHAEAFLMTDDPVIYTVAYRPERRNDVDQIDLWPTPLAVGESLPIVPLALRGTRAIPLDLDATYTEARLRSRL